VDYVGEHVHLKKQAILTVLRKGEQAGDEERNYHIEAYTLLTASILL
jgi:hypothetical protein